MTSDPNRRYTALITSADALVWEMLPRQGQRRDLILMIVLASIAGFSLGLLPDGWTDGWRFYAVGLSFCVLGYCSWMTIRTLWAYLRARRRIGGPIELTVSQWSDRFEITEGGNSRLIAFDRIGAIVPTASHLFITADSELIILPVSAFESEQDLGNTALALAAQLRDPD